MDFLLVGDKQFIDFTSKVVHLHKFNLTDKKWLPSALFYILNLRLSSYITMIAHRKAEKQSQPTKLTKSSALKMKQNSTYHNYPIKK